jgi:predicted GIY-YIG superfamily endonuclease
LAYIEQYANKSGAMAREQQLKSWKSNKRIKELILRSTNE